MDDILKINNLGKNYKEFCLKNISFNIPKGSIMGLIGENGAGKTTTLKLILNLIKSNGGNIEVFGLDHIGNELEIKQRLGVVLDESYFHDNLKPREISMMMKHIYKTWDKTKFLGYLNRFKLPKDRAIKEFSKGMKMKLSIAVALSHDAQLLILDEPTSGLDPVVRNEMLDIFSDFIQDEEKSILFSTHITSDLDKIADYITFIHNGEIVFSKAKDELISGHRIIKCGESDFNKIDKLDIINYRKNKFGCEVLIKDRKMAISRYKDFLMDSVNLEDIMLFYIRGDNDDRTSD
ncbi:MAG TPA: ABC transporter ATP-binding protein [Epulopiscium sp.]|nr:ABC transporter ATP-binding protein [Candidatus Epulonipiscium sp.]